MSRSCVRTAYAGGELQVRCEAHAGGSGVRCLAPHQGGSRKAWRSFPHSGALDVAHS